MNVVCTPTAIMDRYAVPESITFAMLEQSPGSGVGEIGATFVNQMRHAGAVPTVRAWDFLPPRYFLWVA